MPQYPQITQRLQSRTITSPTHLRGKLTFPCWPHYEHSAEKLSRDKLNWHACRRELYNIENKYIFFAGKFSISLCPLELSLHYWLFHNPVIIESEKPAAAQTMAGTAVKTEVSGLISFHQSLASGAESQSLRCCSVNLLNNLYQFTVFNDIFHVSKQSCKLKFKRHSFLEIEKNLSFKFLTKHSLIQTFQV